MLVIESSLAKSDLSQLDRVGRMALCRLSETGALLYCWHYGTQARLGGAEMYSLLGRIDCYTKAPVNSLAKSVWDLFSWVFLAFFMAVSIGCCGSTTISHAVRNTFAGPYMFVPWQSIGQGNPSMIASWKTKNEDEVQEESRFSDLRFAYYDWLVS